MSRYRAWGTGPYSVALVHGGPGAPGEMAPVAQELAATRGVLEPFQSAATARGQVEELAAQLGEHADPPVVLAGHSWGAMLALLVAAAHPSLVGRLVLIGSGPLDSAYAGGIMEARLARLAPADRDELLRLQRMFADPSSRPGSADLARYGELCARADAVDPVAAEPADVAPQPDIYRRVWTEAAGLREAGHFVEQARSVACPVTVIHGVADPHPVDGVVRPLRAAGLAPRVRLLGACGHVPWRERQARDRFFDLLRRECAGAPR